MKVVSVAGYSKTGKSTTAVALIKKLKSRGYSVAAIKDIHNEEFTMEKEGSDSYRMQKAGAEAVFARGLSETYLIRPQKMELTEMVGLLKSDWLVIEGMKYEALPKVNTAASTEELDELVDGTTLAITGKISQQISFYKDFQVIDNLKEIDKLCDLVVEKVFDILPLPKDGCCSKCGLTCHQMVAAILAGTAKRSDCIVDGLQKIKVEINGSHIKMVPFVAGLLYDLIHSFLKNLKGYRKGKVNIEC